MLRTYQLPYNCSQISPYIDLRSLSKQLLLAPLAVSSCRMTRWAKCGGCCDGTAAKFMSMTSRKNWFYKYVYYIIFKLL